MRNQAITRLPNRYFRCGTVSEKSVGALMFAQTAQQPRNRYQPRLDAPVVKLTRCAVGVVVNVAAARAVKAAQAVGAQRAVLYLHRADATQRCRVKRKCAALQLPQPHIESACLPVTFQQITRIDRTIRRNDQRVFAHRAETRSRFTDIGRRCHGLNPIRRQDFGGAVKIAREVMRIGRGESGFNCEWGDTQRLKADDARFEFCPNPMGEIGHTRHRLGGDTSAYDEIAWAGGETACGSGDDLEGSASVECWTVAVMVLPQTIQRENNRIEVILLRRDR